MIIKDLNSRRSGVLCHPTSLPNSYGVGTLGAEAYQFVDLLTEMGQTVWQILPIGPVSGEYYSPYQTSSIFAGNYLLIDLTQLVNSKLLFQSELDEAYIDSNFSSSKVSYKEEETIKQKLLRVAYDRFRLSGGRASEEYSHFYGENGWWLETYALFSTMLKRYEGAAWCSWDKEIAFRDSDTIKALLIEEEYEIGFWCFVQMQFFKQWVQLKSYANDKGISILGDMPLYVDHNSADVWANRELFSLTDNGLPDEISGVPPDYFSEDGQLWGMPVFNWDKMAERDYDWWISRVYFNLRLFDNVRIDHFRGLSQYWAVPASHETARNGVWKSAHGWQLLEKLESQLGYIPIFAEDLGTITPDVKSLMARFNLAGMRVLQFAFMNNASNEHLPHNYIPNMVVYTGTHDNNTTVGWLDSLVGEEKAMLTDYVSKREPLVWDIITLSMGSVANSVIIPLQDILELGEESKMNTPGIADGNWAWRSTRNQFDNIDREKILKITERFGRI